MPEPSLQDHLERAAWAMWRADGEPTGVAKRDPYRKLALALAAEGLLPDPATEGSAMWVLSRVREALGTPDGRAVSIHAAEVVAELECTRRERDLAIAHDRQPYPTASAYEQACNTIRAKQDRIDAALEWLDDADGMELTRVGIAALKQKLRGAEHTEVPNA